MKETQIHETKGTNMQPIVCSLHVNIDLVDDSECGYPKINRDHFLPLTGL